MGNGTRMDADERRYFPIFGVRAASAFSRSRFCRSERSEESRAKKEAKDMATFKDPVCGMMVEEKKAAATSEYKGKTYYFCAKGCKVAFDKDPEKYIGKEPPKHGK
jgi:Cu+-exporting ATPase